MKSMGDCWLWLCHCVQVIVVIQFHLCKKTVKNFKISVKGILGEMVRTIFNKSIARICSVGNDKFAITIIYMYIN